MQTPFNDGDFFSQQAHAIAADIFKLYDINDINAIPISDNY